MAFIFSPRCYAYTKTNSDPWHHSRVALSCEPADAGYVYAKQGENQDIMSQCVAPRNTYTGVFGRTWNNANFPCLWTICTKSANDDLYTFDYWECTLCEGDIINYSGRTSATVGTQISTQSANVYVPVTEDADQTTITKWGIFTYYTDDPSTDRGVVNARWVAHYKVREHKDVNVSENNSSLGAAFLAGPDGTTNIAVGQDVTISIKTAGYNCMFLGWKHNDEWVRDANGDIIRDPSYTFTVTDANKGEYIAQFKGGYTFFRIKNHSTGHYLTSDEYFSVEGEPTLQDLKNALDKFTIRENLTTALSDQGTVIKWSTYPRTGASGTVNVMEIRGVTTNDFYDVNNGVYLRMSHESDNSYDIGNDGTDASYHIEERNNGVIRGTTMTTGKHFWDFEGIDQDLTTKENYFTPPGLVQNSANGLWYTTHRASWNTMFDTNEITAYVLTGTTVNGLMKLTPVTGGIIPAGMPVLLECKSNDVTRNVMIPTLTAASFSTTTTNEMTSAEHYYPDQPAPESAPSGQSYYALGSTTDGRVGFVSTVTNTSTGFHGNNSYYLGGNEAVLSFPSASLQSILSSGDVTSPYEVGVLTAVALADNGSLIIAKDNAAQALPTATGDQVDYMALAGITRPNNSQSNWVTLRVPDGQNASNVIDVDKTLTNVQGKLVSTTNPEIQLDVLPTSGSNNAYTLNTYIPASFYGTQVSPVNQKTYFFVQPQPMEYASIKWAQWDGTKFITVPTNNSTHSNLAGLQGSFTINDSYLRNGSVGDLVGGAIYSMEGVVKLGGTSSSAPRRAPGEASYVFYPTVIQQQAESIVTAVDAINASEVVGVTYYDVTGRASDMPHRGVNIVVTRYRDGSVTTTKILR